MAPPIELLRGPSNGDYATFPSNGIILYIHLISKDSDTSDDSDDIIHPSDGIILYILYPRIVMIYQKITMI